MEFLNPEKTLGLFDNFKYNIHKKNDNGTIRWRCESCKSMSVTTDLDGVLTRTLDANNSHKNVLTPLIKWWGTLIRFVITRFDCASFDIILFNIWFGLKLSGKGPSVNWENLVDQLYKDYLLIEINKKI
ncbi:hypothetical protein BpHYR1_049529 [Brachionus plicatilis]|uniref:Uncharacterized protein n=1 Tax=Brachionus plicatilis TaxID=10195 RepID=A0A3M7QQA1_BRAPC|nr:hypothetical protein BpHYR1_049529 [Brachionus plicatilis]